MVVFQSKFKDFKKKTFEEITKKELLELWGFRGISDDMIALYYQTDKEQVVRKRQAFGIDEETVQLIKYKLAFKNITEQEIRSILKGKASEQFIQYVIDYKRYYDEKAKRLVY